MKRGFVKKVSMYLLCMALLGSNFTTLPTAFATSNSIDSSVTEQTEGTEQSSTTASSASTNDSTHAMSNDGATSMLESGSQSTTGESTTVDSTTLSSVESSVEEIKTIESSQEEIAPASVDQKNTFSVQVLTADGWSQSVTSGGEAGTEGTPIRELKVLATDDEGNQVTDSIQVRGYHSKTGWGSSAFQNGTTIVYKESGQPLEAIQMKLPEGIAEDHIVFYRTFNSTTGWLGWAKDGESAGTTGLGAPIEKVQFMVKKKSERVALDGGKAFYELKSAPTVSYQSHVQSIGWQNFVKNGALSGTTGQAKRVEAVSMKVDVSGMSGAIDYSPHVQSIGWMEPRWQGTPNGTTGRGLQVEALRISLSGDIAKFYDVYYQVHAQNFGWLDWAKNGADAGTTGYKYRIEAYRVQLVKKGSAALGPTNRPNVAFKQPNVRYSGHLQTYGWTQGGKANGAVLGTTGQSKRIEALKMTVDNLPLAGGIEYRVHGQTYGWQSYRGNGQMAGTEGQAKRIEAIQVRLTGELAKHFIVYYRTHTQSYGWLGWASNGASAGSQGLAKRIEALQVMIIPKNRPAPGGGNPFVQQTVLSTTSMSRYVRVNSNISGFLNQPNPQSGVKVQYARFRGHMVRATKQAKTSSGTYYYVVTPGGELGWVAANQTTDVHNTFWMNPTDGPYPSLNVPNLNIDVSVSRQRATIRSGNRTLYTMLCSSGLGIWPNNLSSPHGNFRIQVERGDWFWSGGSGAAFYRSYHQHGVYLFHTVPIAYPGTTTVFNVVEAMKLGTRASHGCIRLSVADAKWFYYNMPYNVPVSIHW